jgi:SAM-dependent methyltransferase
MSLEKDLDLNKAARRGEPSYVWREGQQRRLEMILNSAGNRINGLILENGCGVGLYVKKISHYGGNVIGLEYDFDRAIRAGEISPNIINAASEHLPFAENYFSLLLSHEVLEHVQDDRQAIVEIVRILKPGGRAIIFCPNRGYPFETHGIYWRGKYRFGNIPLVNWLPRRFRDKLAPHVRVYNRSDLRRLLADLPLRIVDQSIIFGAYDNIIARNEIIGKTIRGILQTLEHTPLKVLGLSHFLVLEKI